SALEKAAQLRAGHGPTEATLAWCAAKLGAFEQAEAALRRAEDAGYAPAALHALRGFCRAQVLDHAGAELAVSRALKEDRNNRPPLAARATLAKLRAMAKGEVPPPDAFDDVEQALKAGPPDGYLELWAAQFYAWAAYRAPEGKPDPRDAKGRAL